MANQPTRPHADYTILAVAGLASVAIISLVALTIWAPVGTETVIIIGLILAAGGTVVTGILNYNKAAVAAIAALAAQDTAALASKQVQQLDIKVDGRLTQLLASKEESGVLAATTASQAAKLAAQETARLMADDVARLTAQVAAQSAQAAATVAAQAAATAAAQAAAQTATQLIAPVVPVTPASTASPASQIEAAQETVQAAVQTVRAAVATVNLASAPEGQGE